MAARAEFHTKFRALDDAHQKSLVSMSTQALVDVAVKPTDGGICEEGVRAGGDR